MPTSEIPQGPAAAPTVYRGSGAAISLSLAARVALDVLWFVPGLGPLATGALLGGLFGRALTNIMAAPVRGPIGPIGWIGLSFGAWVALAVLRDPGSGWAWVYAGHYVGPLIVAAAVWVERPSPRGLFGPALLAWLGVLGLGLLQGSAGVVVLHGWPRLVGAHGNLHTLAAGLAVLTPLAATLAATATSRRERRLGWAIAILAGTALGLTFVRTAWIWASVTGVVSLVALRRLRAAGGFVGLGTMLALASGRFSTLLRAAAGEAPEGGWGKLGSSRIEIWQHAVQDFVAADLVTWGFGAGLGGHLGVYRHFDPHSEVLALVWQLGLPGLGLVVALWGAIGLELARRAYRQPTPWAALALGLWAGAMVTAPLSNDLVTRTTASWMTWACWAVALAGAPATARTPPPPV